MKCRHFFTTAALAALCPLTAHAVPDKGKPELTAQTMRSGGPINPEQASLRFDHADLAFEVFPDSETIKGVATLDFTATGSLNRLLIDLDRNLPVSAVSINGKALRPAAWTNPEGKLAITLPRHIAKGGTIRAKITYGGTPHVAVRAPWDDGMVWARTPDGQPWIATTAEGYGCDLFWPCLDFPTGEPGSVDLHITVPAGLKAPSNGVLKGVDTLPDGRTRWNWHAKHPNTYAIALNIGPYKELHATYHSRYGNDIPLYYWYLPGEEEAAKDLFAEFAPTLDFYESKIGPYPFGDEKMGVVHTPYLGMEHQTINGYGNHYKKTPSGFDEIFQHEFGHEWFANQLTAANWDDYWLHEGFEEYMQPLYGLWLQGQARYDAMMLDQRNRIVNKVPMVRGRVITEEEVYEAKDGGPGQDIYFKGAWMLHTLRNLIGDKDFYAATRLEVYGRPDPKPGNFTPRYGSTDEFVRNVNRVTGKDYGWFFNVYLKQAALPELQQHRGNGRLDLSWKVPGGGPFPMPVEVQAGDRFETVPMTDGHGSIAVPDDAHIVLDPHARILKVEPAVEAAKAWEAEQQQ
ncbi:M1 family metallopeptidase [Stakelama sp. CBK3Z-3]|uniref:M1 family metallopeptidase n=1 Tax=Stakelama flava TaxID=2860338 RepID=A0ABS6XJI7_9SPHN|nr:M1 family metallopeptidase [Stakelama flava]MBW4329566.1 M1 family metallopeptidase [Stakelama flava]